MLRFMRPTAACVLLFAIQSGSALAQEEEAQAAPVPEEPEYTQRWIFELGRDDLDNNLPSWQEYAITRAGTTEERLDFFGTVRKTERFDESDTELEAGVALPLSPNWRIAFEASVSPSHEILPKHGLFAELALKLTDTFVLRGGYRTLDFDDKVDVLNAGLERDGERLYFSYELLRSELASESQNSHATKVGLNYGNGSRVGIGYVTGSEAVRVNTGRVIISDIESRALTGLHWFRQWGISYTIGRFEQGEFYTRDGVLAGFAYRF